MPWRRRSAPDPPLAGSCEGIASGATEQKLITIAPGDELVLDQVVAQPQRDRH
jgi:hypothetical protein